ncbi:MAG: TrkH family potassium uptake protein, partial [Lachnospiraceae bacterium]|nr:TrkH family potassium uptake protein [Lachnospiraceae bacterium]
MNYKSLCRFISLILVIVAGLMFPALILALAFHEPHAATAYWQSIGIILVLGGLFFLLSRGEKAGDFYEKEGLACAGLSWIIMGLTGALPFFLSREIPAYIDAFFETVSGFTTTGASILSEVESMSKSLLYWRSFTHWIGGMGVLVFLLALVPRGNKGSGFTLHLLRAESPGPSVGKLVPQIHKTARILYLIYVGLTLLDFGILALGGLFFHDGQHPTGVFDAFCIAVGTAGTGGFAVINAGLGGYSIFTQVVTTVFMFLFGINFSCYFLILRGDVKSVIKDEELRTFLIISLLAIVAFTVSIIPQYQSTGAAIKDAAFTVGSLASTTGYATTNFNTWPNFTRAIVVFLTIMGACAGSTCGGAKVIRLILVVKNLFRNLRQMIRPNRIVHVRINKRVVSEGVLTNLNTYLAAYVFLLFISYFLVAFDGQDGTTTFTAVLTCFNNVGPGLGEVVGPVGNFGSFSVGAKLVLIVDMLLGRLEIFPILA